MTLNRLRRLPRQLPDIRKKKKIIFGDTREGQACWVRRFERRYKFPPPMNDDPVCTHINFSELDRAWCSRSNDDDKCVAGSEQSQGVYRHVKRGATRF